MATLSITRRQRLYAAAAAGVLVAVGAVVPDLVSPADAAACSGNSGVTVVVDFASLTGGVRRTCSPGDPTSGLAALRGAGFTYAFVPRQPGFVCQINTKPNPCNGAPTSAYWSYWHAVPGGKWQFSNAGAGTYNPKPGTVEGWAFGAGKPPSIKPPSPTTTTTR